MSPGALKTMVSKQCNLRHRQNHTTYHNNNQPTTALLIWHLTSEHQLIRTTIELAMWHCETINKPPYKPKCMREQGASFSLSHLHLPPSFLPTAGSSPYSKPDLIFSSFSSFLILSINKLVFQFWRFDTLNQQKGM